MNARQSVQGIIDGQCMFHYKVELVGWFPGMGTPNEYFGLLPLSYLVQGQSDG